MFGMAYIHAAQAEDAEVAAALEIRKARNVWPVLGLAM
jgi:hypothetical protein